MESKARDDRDSWLRWLGIQDCKCKYEWRSIGILYGISMGKGWVRMDTQSNCPHHAKGK